MILKCSNPPLKSTKQLADPRISYATSYPYSFIHQTLIEQLQGVSAMLVLRETLIKGGKRNLPAERFIHADPSAQPGSLKSSSYTYLSLASLRSLAPNSQGWIRYFPLNNGDNSIQHKA